jgi:hypothetical protein
VPKIQYAGSIRSCKVYKTSDGWIDEDDSHAGPFKTREAARRARRLRLVGYPDATISYSVKTSQGYGVIVANLTPLQKRAIARCVSMGVDENEAETVALTNGYNATVSYGHIRQAGATDMEARQIIAHQDAKISLEYGTARGIGFDHPEAYDHAMSTI